MSSVCLIMIFINVLLNLVHLINHGDFNNIADNAYQISIHNRMAYALVCFKKLKLISLTDINTIHRINQPAFRGCHA